MKHSKFPWPVARIVLIAMVGAGLTVAIAGGLSGLFETGSVGAGGLVLVLTLCGALVLRWANRTHGSK